MQTNKVVSQENQSQMIQNYVMGSSAFLYNEKSPLNCGSPGLFSRELNNKTYIDTETSLIRGQISQPIIQQVPDTSNETNTKSYVEKDIEAKQDIGLSTRLKRPDNILSGITIDRFEPLNQEQIDSVTRHEPRLNNFGIDTRNVIKYNN